MSKERCRADIPNTFLPRCRNKTFSINGLVYLLVKSFYKEEELPEEIRVKVRAEINRRWAWCEKNGTHTFPL